MTFYNGTATFQNVPGAPFGTGQQRVRFQLLRGRPIYILQLSAPVNPAAVWQVKPFTERDRVRNVIVDVYYGSTRVRTFYPKALSSLIALLNEEMTAVQQYLSGFSQNQPLPANNFYMDVWGPTGQAYTLTATGVLWKNE